MQVGVRSYSKCYYFWPDFSVIAKKHKLLLNCHLKNYVASLEDIPDPRLDLHAFWMFGFCFAENLCSQFFFCITPCPPPHPHTTPSYPNPTHQPSLHLINRFKQKNSFTNISDDLKLPDISRFIFRQLRMTFFQKIMVAEKNNFSSYA